tara:strand:- start:140 stop:301 length:162 start_codon:yes stop_codon:yes gene_type:complete
MNDQDILQRINYEINKRFDERDKSFDRLERLIFGLYLVTVFAFIFTKSIDLFL